MSKFQKVFICLTIGVILSLMFCIPCIRAAGPSRNEVMPTTTPAPKATGAPLPSVTPEATETPSPAITPTPTPAPTPTVVPTPTTAVIISGGGEISFTLTGKNGGASLTATITDGKTQSPPANGIRILFIIWILFLIL
ncbi:MAG: hypothetical protein K6U80_08135 [Firmicutes bacterium]|nr:hypothetical protein [Bacillota bacterium]